jgi:hypothetical protein
LLARLEIERAPTPSSFWSYCGLATVAAQIYRCPQCGYELSLAVGRHLRSGHRIPGSGESCGGTLHPNGDGARRVAQPRPSRGENASYDREAKKLCYLIGMSFVRQGDSYKRYYAEQRARLDVAKPDWIPRRRHLTALRMTESCSWRISGSCGASSLGCRSPRHTPTATTTRHLPPAPGRWWTPNAPQPGTSFFPRSQEDQPHW